MGLDKKCTRRTRDGYKVCAVNGEYLRTNRRVDFIGGGNHFAYPKLVPKNELWAEKYLPKNDFAAIIEHERVEANEMRHDRLSYIRAHNIANRAEDRFRARYRRRRY